MSDTSKKMRDIDNRQYETLKKTLVQMRSIIPILKDHNLSNTAKPCEELLFEFDVIEEERAALVKQDPHGCLEEIIARITRNADPA